MDARERARLEPHALLHALVPEVRTPRPRRDRDARGRPRREPHLAVAHERDRPEVACLQGVRADGVDACLRDRVGRERHSHVQDVRRAEEPLDVLRQPEDCGAAVVSLVAADALEHAEPVVQRVREDMDVRLVPRDERAVEPDAFGLLHGRATTQKPPAGQPRQALAKTRAYASRIAARCRASASRSSAVASSSEPA